jgi:glycosidase
MVHFHISSDAVNQYKLGQFLDAATGRFLVEDYQICQQLIIQLNQSGFMQANQPVKPWLINGHALIHSIYHLLFKHKFGPQQESVWDACAKEMEKNIPRKEVDKTLKSFQSLFIRKDAHLWESSSFEELLYTWISNQNPALFPINGLMSDQPLVTKTAYPQVMDEMQRYFSTQALPMPGGMDFITFLLAPIRHAPDDLLAQLEYIRTHWQSLLGDELLALLNAMDIIREEEKAWFFGGPVVEIPDYASMLDAEQENFSEDQNWMPRLVLIAKNIYVWLYQLSKQWHREITKLDQIPDETLQELASHGFSGLWLIGVWERSQASANIKRLCGNPEALASAYSLADYQIANDLGGVQAYNNLKERAARLGIRMGTDMVPNHMGIDSPWIKHHPDWFVSLDSPPYPSYTFNGPNLSADSGYNIQIEDHYYERTDAAVVFRYEKYTTGEVHYIYHGNDGTSMPWNDTAQLNYLDATVREAIIQTILKVARLSPIIRFDAAMILTKRHYQRLWFPAPGHAGDIPSRAGRGVSEEEFNRLMPQEFWREVVDRVAREVPDTLLLAEAFWMMESYFVRTLGMHRVYNSAFMHLLRDEENQKFLTLIRNTLEYNPEILKRYVNFMNNPDEETAVQQFSKEDKYFGVCTMLATFPGLPMFGHGQIEGFHEKYGMEYRQAYLNEQPDIEFILRHEREIFPLLKRRGQFSEVNKFRMYNFQVSGGGVNENVYAYTNLVNEKRSLVLYHNRYAETSGWVHYCWETGQPGVSLVDALEIPLNDSAYVLFRDHVENLWYIRKTMDLHQDGLFVKLGAYKYHVYLDFKIIPNDESGFYQRLYDHLKDNGTASIEEEAIKLLITPLQECIRKNPIYFLDQGPSRIPGHPSPQTSKPFADRILQNWHKAMQPIYNLEPLRIPTEMEWKLDLQELDHQYPVKTSLPLSELPLEALLTVAHLTMQVIQPVFSHLQHVPEIRGGSSAFGQQILQLYQKYELEEEQKQYLVLFQLFLMEWINFGIANIKETKHLEIKQGYPQLLASPSIQRLLQVNTYKEITWFNREACLLFLLATKIAYFLIQEKEKQKLPEIPLDELITLTEESGYQLEILLAYLNTFGEEPALP